MYKNYNVVVANDIDELSIKVSNMLDVGYTTAGGIQIVTDERKSCFRETFYQAVVVNQKS